MDEITITLPLPPKALSPNSRGHWSKKSRATYEYRTMAEMEARRVVPFSKRPGWLRVETAAVFYFPVDRLRDEDNAAASLKPAWDGLADAGIIQNDKGLTHERPRLLIDQENPRVELTIRPIS